MEERVNNPAYYGGKDNPYEAIKVIARWCSKMTGVTAFGVGNALKYISRAGKKSETTLVEDLQKAAWYLRRAAEVESAPWTEPASVVNLGPEPRVNMGSHRVAAEWNLPGGVQVALFNIFRGHYDVAAAALEEHLKALEGESR